MTALESAAIARAVLDTEVTWMSIPLASAVLCADRLCETVWDQRHKRCPKCDGEECFPLAARFSMRPAKRERAA